MPVSLINNRIQLVKKTSKCNVIDFLRDLKSKNHSDSIELSDRTDRNLCRGLSVLFERVSEINEAHTSI